MEETTKSEERKKDNNLEQFFIRLFRILPILMVISAILYSVVIVIILISPVWIILSLCCYLLGNEEYIRLTGKIAFDTIDFFKNKITAVINNK